MAQQQPSSSSSSSLLGIDTVDDFYFSVVSDDETDPDVPVSDDKYAEALQFQETVLASLITYLQNPFSSSSSKTVDEVEELLFKKTLQPPLHCVASSSNSVHVETFLPEEEPDDSSSIIVCEICAEGKTNEEMFRNELCYHSFCSECVVKQVAIKIQDSITNVPCPGLNCKGVLKLESCRSLLPKEVIDRWDDALCEAHLLTVPKFYCPFKDCSAMLLDENEGVEDIRESECPFCHRLFCARCLVPWHPGIGCEEYQRLNPDERGSEDLLVRELANQKKWKRCPRCRYYVEKRDGCLHITCRCKYEFCYACGERWTNTHGGCQRN